ncbi:MAG: HAD family hydrolase [Burkholderiales bacterium]
MSAADAVLFDLGKVLLDWDPRYYYKQFFPDDAAGLERFVTQAVGPDFILAMDAGRPAAEVIPERCARFPDDAALIARWPEGWPRMLRGPIAGTVEILRELKARGTRLYALTNFSTETWPVARARFEFLGWFEDTIVSGEHGLIKPDPRIYALAIGRCRLDPSRTVFIDDAPANVAAGRTAGFDALLFETPEKLRADLQARGLLDG